MKEEFKFNLGDRVKLRLSSEAGEVIGRAEYSRSKPQYLVEYLAGDGRQVDSWKDEDALVAA